MIINFEIQGLGNATMQDLQSWILWPLFKVLLLLLFIDKANDAVVVPLRFDHNSLIYGAVLKLPVGVH